MYTYEKIARHPIPERKRYIEIIRCVETGSFSVALRDDEERIVSGNNYGNLVLVDTDLTDEAQARSLANATWEAQRRSADVQTTARIMVATRAAMAS